MKLMKRALAILIATLMIVSLTACGASPTSAAESFLNAVKAGDAEAIAEVYVESDFNILSAASDTTEEEEATEEESSDALTKVYEEELLPKMQDFDFEISNEQIDGDKATVDVTVKAYPIGNAFSAFFGEYMTQAFALAFSDASDEQLDSIAGGIMADQVSKLTEKTCKKTATMTLVKKDDKWVVDKIDSDSDILDAISGGLVTTVKNLDSAWGE